MKTGKKGWELGMQCKEQEVGGFDPFIRIPNSHVTQCNYNPGRNSWDKNTIAYQNDTFSSPSSHPVQCWCYTFKSCFNKINTAWGGGEQQK